MGLIRHLVDIDEEVKIRTDGVLLEGTLTIPCEAQGIVLFAHGSGSSRHSTRNIFVAEELNSAGFGTLLIDLLTAEEERVDAKTKELRFNIDMLSRRVTGVVDWIHVDPRSSNMPIGIFGASTGAAAALFAASQRSKWVKAVVCRGGRPDMAQPVLGSVEAPTLLVVGGNDEAVIQINQDAFEQMHACQKEFVIISGATHLFEEDGALEEVGELAAGWFINYLR